jgi:sugar/nucleoside kinase (ribokinase family)
VRPRGFADLDEMRRVILEASADARLVKASIEDLRALGIEDDDPAVLLRGKTVAAVVTLGAAGCRWATFDGSCGSAAAPRLGVVDTTGAGDAFMAALLWRSAYHHGCADTPDAITDAVGYAVVAGAVACTKEGAIASLPRADALTSAVMQVVSTRR